MRLAVLRSLSDWEHDHFGGAWVCGPGFVMSPVIGALFVSAVLLLSVHIGSSDFCSFNFHTERKGATRGEE